MKMDIIIKNVTGKIENDYYISELSRCGFPAGSIIRNPEHQPKNKGCYWTSGTDQCVAFIGQTCAVRTLYYKSEIVYEHGNIGSADCSMEIIFEDDNFATIIWYFEYDDGTTNAIHIELWFENKTLTKFDGLTSLPEPAKQLIRLNCFRVPDEF